MLSSKLDLFNNFPHLLDYTFFHFFPLCFSLISDAFTWSVCAWHMVCHHGPFCNYPLCCILFFLSRWTVPLHGAEKYKLDLKILLHMIFAYCLAKSTTRCYSYGPLVSLHHDAQGINT